MSNNERFPALSANWQRKRLGVVADLINPGFPCGQHNKKGKGVPHLRPMNVSPKGEIDLSEVKFVEEEYDALREGDVLFNNTNSPVWVGKTAHVDKDADWAYSNHMTRLRGFPPGLDSKWVAFWLHFLFEYGYFRHHCSNHVNQASIGVGFLEEVEVPVPPLAEQRRIVAKIEELFSDLDAGLADLKKAQRQLRRYRQSVLHAAAEGRLTEGWRAEHPDAEPAETLLERVAQAHRESWERRYAWKRYERKGKQPPSGWKDRYEAPDALDDSADLSVLPQSWKWVRAEQICGFITKGTTPKKSKMYAGEGKIPFVKVYNLTNSGKLDFTVNPTFVDEETHVGKLARSRLYPGDVLINIVGPPLGQVSIVPEDYPEWNMNQAIARYRALKGIDNTYLSYLLRSRSILNWAKKRSKATAGQFNLTLAICRDLPLPLPPEEEQRQIVSEVERLLSVAEEAAQTVERELKRAERLRQSILKRAFSGRLVPQDEASGSGGTAGEGSANAEGAQAEQGGTRQLSLFSGTLRAVNAGPGIEAIRGTWPGDETIDEILDALD